MPESEKRRRLCLKPVDIIFRILPAVLVGSFLISTLVAQEPTPSPSPAVTNKTLPESEKDTDIIRVNTDLVQVEAIVKDKSGRTVTGLKSDDFEIIEGGQVRPLEFFSFVPLTNNRKTVESPDKRLAQGEIKRTFVFMLSNPLIDFGYVINNAGGTGSGTISFQRRAMRASEDAARFFNKFVDEQMGERDLVAFVDTEADLGVLSNFTNDREMLRAAVKQMRGNISEGKYSTYRIMAVNDDIGLQPLVQQNLRTIQMAANAVAQLKKLPGRKVIVLLSLGFLDDPRLTGADTVRDNLKKLIAEANKAQVTFYVLGLSGVGNMGGIRGNNLIQGMQDLNGIKPLAEKTGGRAIYNTNDVSLGFEEILKENNGYYTLAWDAGDGKTPQPHQITVRVKNPELTVQFRSTVYKNEAASENLDGNEKLLRILRSPLATRGVNIDLSSVFEPVSKKQGIIKSTLKIDSTILEPEMLTGGTRQVKLDLGIQIIGPDNKLFRQQVKNFTFKLSDESWNQIQKEGLIYQFEADIDKPGYYQVNAAACVPGSNQCGNASRFITATIK